MVYVIAIAGPFALFTLIAIGSESKNELYKIIKFTLAACTLVAYMFLCIGTGIYLGEQLGITFVGLIAAFVFFYYSVVAFGWLLDQMKGSEAPHNGSR